MNGSSMKKCQINHSGKINRERSLKTNRNHEISGKINRKNCIGWKNSWSCEGSLSGSGNWNY